MAGGDQKGFLTGGMKFGVGDDASDPAEARGPLLPLRVLVVSDLVPRDAHNAGASAPEGILRVDPSRFDELFGKLRPRVVIDVPSVLAEGRNVRVDLSPVSLKSFRPDGLCAELPLLRSLLDGRLVLDRLRDGTITEDQAQAELNRLWSGSPFVREVLRLLSPQGCAAAPAAKPQAAAQPAPAGSALDSILSLVDVDGSGAAVGAPQASGPLEPPASPALANKFSAIIADVARSARSGSAGARFSPTEAIQRVDKALGAQIGAILQHPEVRRLEVAWRSLSLLVERARQHSGIRFDVLSARPSDAAAALQRGIRQGASAEPPVSCAIVDITVDGTPASFSQLEAVATVAESYAVPTVVNGCAALLRLSHLGEAERLDNKGNLFSAPTQVLWQSAAAKPPMRWVTIAMNGALARAPYDKSSSRVREAAIQEFPADEGGYVWLSPAHLVGTLITASFRDTGWPCRIVGHRNGGIVENLPVREVTSHLEGDEGIAIPTEAFVSTETQRELAKAGVLLLASAPNSDAVYVLSAPTAYVPPPKRTYDSATTEPEVRFDRVPLVDQLFVARIAQFLRTLCGKLPPDSPPAEAQPVVEGALWALFDSAPPASTEITVTAKGGSEGTTVEVTVRPRRFLGVAAEEISMEVPLG
jgi:type VI secretion system ImpC/EvpB family protein/type VI secretion system ImpB/VipA family protein